MVRGLRRAVLGIVLAAAFGAWPRAAPGQSGGSPPDVLEERAALVVDSLRMAGYLHAVADTTGGRVVVSRGELMRFGNVRLTGVDPDRSDRMRAVMAGREGEPFDAAALEEDVRRLLEELERAGRPLAQVRIDAIETEPGFADRLAVSIDVTEGPPVPLAGIELTGAVRTGSRLAARLTELEIGRPLAAFDPARIRARLVDSGLFEVVGEPELVIRFDTTAVLRIPVREGQPGTFDLVLGYLPPQGGRGRIVGSGHLALNNIFGGGRALSLQLHRMPGQVSRIDVAASDPYVVGLPIGLEASFHGLEQDSTYGKRAYAGGGEVHLAPGVDVRVGFSREITSPGQAGLRLGPRGRQVVPTSASWFLGVGVRVNTVDAPVSPTRGLFVEMNLERGSKRRTERLVEEAEPSRRTNAVDQKRLRLTARSFLPVFSRQVVVVGGDAAVLLSGEVDRSDLFRYGGATSLRGYDEERFLGSFVGRLLFEYRVLLDFRSFAVAFVDVGYVERPETPDLDAVAGLHPGYGIGVQFETVVGLVNVSAALNPDSGPADARIHAGLSFGL